MSKYTPGPLTVKIDNKWPFNIKTFDVNGNCVFTRGMPSNSTRHNTIDEVLSGIGMGDWKDEAISQNARAVADEVLRAAAPELLEALQSMVETWEHGKSYSDSVNEIGNARAAIAKALGET